MIQKTFGTKHGAPDRDSVTAGAVEGDPVSSSMVEYIARSNSIEGSFVGSIVGDRVGSIVDDEVGSMPIVKLGQKHQKVTKENDFRVTHASPFQTFAKTTSVSNV